MKFYRVHGRIRLDFEFDRYPIEAKSVNSAMKIVEKEIYKLLNITKFDVIDEEIYVEEYEEYSE